MSLHSTGFESESVRLDREPVVVGEMIGTGAEGSVYRIEGQPNQVVKIFKANRRNTKAAKVSAMVDNDPNHDGILWPQRTARTADGSEFLGYQMAYKPHDTAKNALEYTMTELGWETSQSDQRHRIASRLAALVEAIHDEGHGIGDFNHDNILIDQEGEVFLIDCDGYHITGDTQSFADDTYYPRYSPPEGRGGDDINSVQKADRFCLGIHVFQFLMEGFHPYLAKGSQAIEGSMEDKLRSNKFPYVYDGYEPIDQAPATEEYLREIPQYLQKRFKQCFTEAGKNIAGDQTIRPGPSEWILPYTEPAKSPTPGPTDTTPPPDGDRSRSPWQDWSITENPDSSDGESDDMWDNWDG